MNRKEKNINSNECLDIRHEETVGGQNTSRGMTLSDAQIEALAAYAWADINKRYSNYAYAVLTAILTGMRTGELMALKWTDIDPNHIIIHSIQRYCDYDGPRGYAYMSWTKGRVMRRKNERYGRIIVLNEELKELFEKIKADQDRRGIESEFVFCKDNGEWGKIVNYNHYLKKASKKLGFEVSNNALRMTFLLKEVD